MKASNNLVLKRNPGSSLEFNFEGTIVTLLFEKNGKVVIQAPKSVKVRRGELVTQDQTPKN
jgi:sRNA-binding carbon storage regulator CsrA